MNLLHKKSLFHLFILNHSYISVHVLLTPISLYMSCSLLYLCTCLAHSYISVHVLLTPISLYMSCSLLYLCTCLAHSYISVHVLLTPISLYMSCSLLYLCTCLAHSYISVHVLLSGVFLRQYKEIRKCLSLIILDHLFDVDALQSYLLSSDESSITKALNLG